MKTIEQLKEGDKVYVFNTLSFSVDEYEVDVLEDNGYGDYDIELDSCMLPMYQDCELHSDGSHLHKNIMEWEKEETVYEIFFYADKCKAVEKANDLLRKKMQGLYATIENNLATLSID